MSLIFQRPTRKEVTSMSVDISDRILAPTSDSPASGTPVTRQYRSGDYLQPTSGGDKWVVDTHGLVWQPGRVAPVDAIPIAAAERRVGARLIPAGSWSEQAPLAASPCHTPALYGCPGCPTGAVDEDRSAEIHVWRKAASPPKPLLIDLFGGEGLAALGYARAGFRVRCVENDPARIANHVQHPDIEVVEGDATTYPLDGAAVVVGSPPCTDHSETAGLANKVRGRDAGTGWMLPHTLERLRTWSADTGGLWVVENVEGARSHFDAPIKLCGTMFDLQDEGWWLQRHRWFESNAAIMPPGVCRHAGKRFISVHGDLSVNDRACGGKRRPGGDMRAGVERARCLMGAPWASARGLSLGIPPAYTRYLGEQLMYQLSTAAVAA